MYPGVYPDMNITRFSIPVSQSRYLTAHTLSTRRTDEITIYS